MDSIDKSSPIRFEKAAMGLFC